MGRYVSPLSRRNQVGADAETAFDLKYYTEARDLGYLLSSLDSARRGDKMRKLNEAMVELIDEYGLVGFETLAVEVSSLFLGYHPVRQSDGPGNC
jgi:hypothetical protein